jgi:hypothetical protein
MSSRRGSGSKRLVPLECKRLVGKFFVQGQIQLQDVNTGFAQKAELSSLGVSAYQLSKVTLVDATDGWDGWPALWTKPRN